MPDVAGFASLLPALPLVRVPSIQIANGESVAHGASGSTS
jgi:hypothetical protein